MNNKRGKHDSQIFHSGEEVHLTKPLGGKWSIKSYDWSRPKGQALETKTVYARDVGWEDHKFDREEDAYTFVLNQIQCGNAPCNTNLG